MVWVPQYTSPQSIVQTAELCLSNEVWKRKFGWTHLLNLSETSGRNYMFLYEFSTSFISKTGLSSLLSLSFSPSLPQCSFLSVHISVCSQELAGLCQTEIRWGCKSPLGGHMEEGQEGNNQAQSSLSSTLLLPSTFYSRSLSFFLFLSSSCFLILSTVSLCLLHIQPARLHRSSGWLTLGLGPSVQSPLLFSFTHCFHTTPPPPSPPHFCSFPTSSFSTLSPGGRRWGHPVLSCPSARVFTCSVTGRHIWSAYSLVFTLFLPLTPRWPSIYPDAATRHIPPTHFRTLCRRYIEPTSNFINSLRNTQAHTERTHRFVFNHFPLSLSPLQWFFSCMTEIGVNHQQGWAKGVKWSGDGVEGARVSLLFSPFSPSSLLLRLYPCFLFCLLFKECKLITAALSLLFGNPWLLLKWSDTLFFILCLSPALLTHPPTSSPCISPTHPPTLSVFPTFLCWCVTVMACHLAGMSCSPTSSPRFGVKHLLLVFDWTHTYAHMQAHTWNASFKKKKKVLMQMVSIGLHTYPWRAATTSTAILR